MKDVIGITVAVFFLMLFLGTIKACTINSERVDRQYVQKLADAVSCAKGYKGKCWCFTGRNRISGVALAPDELCPAEKEEVNENTERSAEGS